jgi:hypothetical protein
MTIRPDQVTQRDWVAQASRAPSAHNTQSARWRFVAGGVELHEDMRRWLEAADPSGRDNRIALGMAWEAMRLACGGAGWRLEDPVFDPNPYPPRDRAVRRVASAALARAEADAIDGLAAMQSLRRCWRGEFAAADPADAARLEQCVDACAHVAMTLPHGLQGAIADAYDRAAAALLEDEPVGRELYRWMRLARRHPDWSRDGLSADCLALSRLDAAAASLLMRPLMQRWLSRLGLLKHVVSERAKTLSATRLVAIHTPDASTPFDAGRRWYRFWLAMTAAGFAAVPMSALVDVPASRAWLMSRVALPAGARLVNVMRVGPMPSPAPPVSARLPVDELILGPS